MKVRSLIRLAHTKVTPETSIEKVWQILSKRNITLLSVVDDEGKLVGVIGEDDLLYRLIPDYREYFSEFFPDAPTIKNVEDKFEKEMVCLAKDVMNRKVVTIGEDQEIFKGLSKMMAHNYRVLPVVSEDKKFLGMLLEDDIMKFLLKEHKYHLKKLKLKK